MSRSCARAPEEQAGRVEDARSLQQTPLWQKSRLTTVAELLADGGGGVKMKIDVGFCRVTLV